MDYKELRKLKMELLQQGVKTEIYKKSERDSK